MLEKRKTKSYSMNLCEGPILKKVFLFAMPLIASGILQLCFNAADVIIVGQFAGDNSLAAVGSNGSIINLLISVFTGLSVGVNVLVARYFAGKKTELLRKTVHTAITVSALSGVFLMMVGLVLTRQLLIWMQSPAEVIDLSTLYMRIYFLGMPANLVYNFGAAILRGIGDTKRPLYFLTLSGAVNVVLNMIFVIVFHMDVAGVAIATVVSQCISAALVIRCLMEEEEVRLEKQYLGIDKAILIEMIQIGLPAGIQGSLFALSHTVVQSSINSFGAIVVAGNSAAQNVESFAYIAVNAFTQTSVAFLSQNVGAEKYERINKIVATTMICVFFVGLVFGNGLYFFGRSILGLYSDSTQVIEAGLKRLTICGMPYAIYGLMDCIVGVLRGLGYSVMPMIVSLLGVCAFRIAWITVFFQFDRFRTIETVYTAFPFSWILTLSVHMICFFVIRKKLKKTWGV